MAASICEWSPQGSYDLITLEPPPIAYSGVAALYSREFYELAISRLTTDGDISQWLPAYQVPEASSLAMVRAFVDVFPQMVLLSGTQDELLLVGRAASRVEIDPLRLANALSKQPAVQADLARLESVRRARSSGHSWGRRPRWPGPLAASGRPWMTIRSSSMRCCRG